MAQISKKELQDNLNMLRDLVDFHNSSKHKNILSYYTRCTASQIKNNQICDAAKEYHIKNLECYSMLFLIKHNAELCLSSYDTEENSEACYDYIVYQTDLASPYAACSSDEISLAKKFEIALTSNDWSDF